MYYVGVDIGGTQIKNGIFDAEGNVIHKWGIDTDVSGDGSYILDDVAKSIYETIGSLDISEDNIFGYGLGVPGAVREDGSVNRCINLGWGDIPVGELFSSKLDSKPVAVVNDANAAALGECWMGAGADVDNMVMITLGTGIGGGVIVDGKLVLGRFSAGGEIGHMTFDPESKRRCQCGKCGCFETYASASGIVKSMEEYVGENTSLSAKDIFDKAKAGDKNALMVVEDSCKIIGIMLSNVSAVIDTDRFVIGGGVSKAGDFLIERIKKYYKQYAFHTSKETEIVLGKLGNDAGIYGAAYAILAKEV